MDYFSYLRYKRLKDTKDNFIGYLVEILGYTELEAINKSKLYYKEVMNNEKCYI